MTPDQREKAELEADRDREEKGYRMLRGASRGGKSIPQSMWAGHRTFLLPHERCMCGACQNFRTNVGGQAARVAELINERKIPTTLNGEKQSATYYMAPVCRCGSRQTKQIGDSALTRQCQVCERTFWYRLHDGMLIPYGHRAAMAIDEERAHGC